MKYYLFLIFTAASLFFTSCGEEDLPLPPYVQDLAEIQTDGAGFASTLITDEGETLKIENKTGEMQPDTLVRVRALYQKSGETAWLNDYVQVLTPHLAQFKEEVIKTDPISLTACWRSAYYVNLRFNLLGTAKGKHIFGFHQTDYVKHKDGSRTIHAILLHDSNHDPKHYYRETYLSLPLRPLNGLLTAGRDTLQLGIMTEKGWITRKIPF